MQTRETAALQRLTARRLTGTPEQIRNAVARYRHTGRLAEITAPQPVPGRPGVITLDVRLLNLPTDEPVPAPAARPYRPRRRWPYILAAVIAALAVIAWAGYLLVTAVTAAAVAYGPILLGVLVVLAVATKIGRRTCTTIVSVTHKH